MRISTDLQAYIKQQAQSIVAKDVCVRIFGSRLDDQAKGGDLDLLVETSQVVNQPALVSAQLAAKISRKMLGRKVDVVLSAPNLQQQAIHKQARNTGTIL